MFNKRSFYLIVLSIINLIAQIFIFLLHQGKLNIIGIEAIKELNFNILIPSIFLVIVALINFKIKYKLLQFLGLLSLSIVIYIISVHTGAREAVSFLEHWQYCISMLTSIAIITVATK